MAASKKDDSRESPRFYQSSRYLWEVVIGEDKALPVIEASATGDAATLRTLLSQPHWIEAMFEEQHIIYSEDCRPSEGKERRVLAGPLRNIERATFMAGINGHATVVTNLLDFAMQHGVEPASMVWVMSIAKIIGRGHAAVIQAIALAWPGLLTFDLRHGELPLYEAVMTQQDEIVAVLLKLGADPFRSYLGRLDHNLLYAAAKCRGRRMVELLLQYNVPIAGSHAIDSAAGAGQHDTISLLIDRGADVNEENRGFTPMHSAAIFGKTETMAFLKSIGGNADAKNGEGETPAELYERTKREKKIAWTKAL